MQNQEGIKPLLSVVGPDDIDYKTTLMQMVGKLATSKASGDKINPYETISFLDPTEDNSIIRDWMDSNGVISKAQFDKVLAKIQRDEVVRRELGFVPANCQDFVEQYVSHNRISITANEQLVREVKVVWRNVVIDTVEARTSDEAALIYDLGKASSSNLEDFRRELRLVRDKVKLDYRDTSISDAVTSWSFNARKIAKMEMFLDVQFAKGKATGPEGQAMWAAMEAACFDMSDTKPGFAVSVLQKFMWQVKRKARGLPITNHLMPILTGPQGKGKSTFIETMCAPLADTMKHVDFRMVTDEKIIDIWNAHILFIDEMSNFSKSDVDVVKNVISTPTLTRRPMRSNDTVQVNQESTFIGCANKSLGQLIRDDTGGRRFAELVWSLSPKWDAVNAVNWMLLWQSVDETGPDPIVTAGMVDLLKDQQERNRYMGSIETWARTMASDHTSWKSAADLHGSFRLWEEENFPALRTDVNNFGRGLTGFISNLGDFPMEKKRTSAGIVYRYSAGL